MSSVSKSIAAVFVAALLIFGTVLSAVAYTSSNSAITVYPLSRYKTAARYDSSGQHLITSYTIPSSDITWYVNATTTGGSSYGQYRSYIYDSSAYSSIPEHWFSVWNWYSTSTAAYNRVNFDGLLSGTTVVITLNLTVNPYNTSGGNLCADLLFVDNEATVSSYARFGYMSSNSNHSPINPNFTVTDSYSSGVLGLGSQTVIVQLSFVMDTVVHDGLFPIIVFYDSAYVPYYGIVVNSADISVGENVPLNVANNIVINDIYGTVQDIQQGVEDVNQGVQDVNQGVQDVNQGIDDLRDDLLNGSDMHFSSEDTLPSDDYDQASEDIDTVFHDATNFWTSFEDVVPWFKSFWQHLLDDTGGGTPFLLLIPAAFFVLLRNILGR